MISFRIGDQLTSLDVDNFSLDDESLNDWLDLEMLGKHCLHLDHLSLCSTKLDMQGSTKLDVDMSSTTELEMPAAQSRKALSSSRFSSLSHLFLKSNTFRSPKVSISLFLPLLLLQVLSQLLISTRSLTHLTIFHKLNAIHQNRTPSQVIQSNSTLFKQNVKMCESRNHSPTKAWQEF